MDHYVLDADARRRVIEDTETGSLAELALFDYDKKATEAEQRAEEQRRIREQWAARLEEKYPTELIEKLAKTLGISADHPALADLNWTIDRDNLAELEFSTPPGLVRIAKGNPRKASLFAHVAKGVYIEASLWIDDAKSIRFFITDDPKKISTLSLTNLTALGVAIIEGQTGAQ